MNAENPRIGFIGLGLMGSPICMKLIEAGRPVTIWGRTPEKLAPAIAAGASLAETPRALATEVDVVMLCVTDAAAVEEVVFSEAGIVAGASRGSLLIDHSSIRPGATREMAAKLQAVAGMAWVDAPVSGGVPGVFNKTLVAMCGGEEPSFERARRVIEIYAGRCTRVGGIGAGQTTKLFNQALCGITFVAVAEVTALALRAGIDATIVPVAIAGGRADSRILQEYMPRMARHDRKRSARIDTMLKDLQAFTELAHENGASTPCAKLAAKVHRQLIARGLGTEDPAAIVSFFE